MKFMKWKSERWSENKSAKEIKKQKQIVGQLGK